MEMDFSKLLMWPLSPKKKEEVEETTNESKSQEPVAPSYYNWRETYPELQLLYANREMIRDEMMRIQTWVPWPEDHFSLPNDYGNTKDWTVFPLCYTFPAYEVKNRTWVPSTTSFCPKTTNLLKLLPNLRTALFSKLGAGTKLSNHTGWADLANYVLRCHLVLTLPSDGYCGLVVDGEVKYHAKDDILVFDDSKTHRAFNNSANESRIVLIVDLVRPSSIPLGTATGDHTEELDSFMSYFK